ncbi:MAG: hypothetical protein M1579_03570, partial [Gammaproteobacteria bacterium]|nr:hypothetical protein [Gammaproteobacteria bacterium]
DRTLDLFFEYYVLSEQETLTDQEKVKLSALKKSLFGDGAPTNEELSQYHYLFVNAPAQQQAGQHVASSKRGAKKGIARPNETWEAFKKWLEKASIREKNLTSGQIQLMLLKQLTIYDYNEFGLKLWVPDYSPDQRYSNHDSIGIIAEYQETGIRFTSIPSKLSKDKK